MKSLIMLVSRPRRCVGLVVLCALLALNVQAQTLTGTYSLPGTVNGQSITNLTTLRALLANPANPVSGNVIFEFGPTYTSTGENFPISFNGFTGTGTVTIRPSAAVTTSLLTTGNIGGATTPLIDLSGADYITFDGRPGGTGFNTLWTFQNTSTTGIVFLFRTATYVTLQYLQLESQNVSTTSGTVTLTTDNHYNTIQNCLITHYAAGTGRPLNGIISYSTTAAPNTNNSILFNHITNFAPTVSNEASGIAITGSGINTNYSSNWTIRGNHLYRTATELGAAGYAMISFTPGSGSTGNVIDENYVGGNSPFAAGIFTTQVSGTDAYIGILVRAGATDVINNLVQGLALTNTNLVSTAVGIQLDGGTTASFNVSDNTIGNFTNPSQGSVVGIYNESTGTTTIDGNTVYGLSTSNAINVAAKTIGIYSNTGEAIITNNTVYGLASATGTGSSGSIGTDAAAAGIVINSIYSGAVQVVSNNTVYHIASSQSTPTAVRVYGIAVTGVTSSGITHILNGNLVYNISGNVLNDRTSPTGIKIRSGSYQVTNNVVRLGYRQDGSAITAASNITGIMDSSSGNSNMTVSLWHNSVFIGGTAVTGTGSSYAFRRFESNISPSNNEDIRNNIFVNNRSNSTGTGKHYGIYLDRTTNVTSNFNIVYGNGTGYHAGSITTSDFITLPAWASGTGLDLSSIGSDPQYIAPTATTPDLHITNSPTASPADQGGTNITAVVYDRDSVLRSTATPTDIGAYAICGSGTAPTVTLVANDTSICAGTQVVFTATVAGVTTVNYNFYRNGASVQNGPTNTYTSSNLANNDSIRVIVTASGACVSSTPVSSTTITMVVTAAVNPTVILGISQNNICPGTSVTFTATPNNGGPAPTFNFIRNGVSVQNGPSNTYTTSSLNNNDSVRVVLTSNAPCTTNPTSTVPGLIVVVKPNATSTLNETICYGDSYLGYSVPGLYRDTLVAANGCDSIRTLTLTIRPENTTTVNASICPGGNYQGYTAPGSYTDTYIDANGCDSTRTLNLTLSNFITNTISETICFGDSYLGYAVAGTYNDTFATGGCDSIRILNLTIRPENTTIITQSICQGQSFEGYTTDGTYTDVFTDANGCDSTRTLTLTVVGTITTSESQTICFGDSYQGQTAPGVYRDTVASSGGCDSIHTLNLIVLDENTDTLILSICEGDSFQGYTETGTYQDTFAAANGCDSVQVLILSVDPFPVVPVITASNNVLSVPNVFATYQWYLDGTLLVGEEADTLTATANGNYTIVVANALGCADTSSVFQVTGIGVENVQSEWSLEYYPNPTDGRLYLSINGAPQADWSLYNSLGQLLQQGQVGGVANTIQLEGYADGVYYLKVQAAGNLVTHKVLLAK